MDPTNTVLRIVGPTKIKDGLFMGDQAAAHDHQWIMMNQVTHIINCCGREVDNLFQQQGINYLTFPWNESETQLLFDTKDSNLNEIVRFIEEATQQGGAVLIHSKESDSRSCCILSAYLMRRFKWNLFKTLEFLNSRKEDVQLQPQFFQQLSNLQSKLSRNGIIKSGNWETTDPNDPEEEIIRNTYLNARQYVNDDPHLNKVVPSKPRRPKLQWKDKEQKNGKIAIEIKYNLDDKISSNGMVQSKRGRIKSILKGSNKIFDIRPPLTEKIEKQNQRPNDESRNKSSKSILEKHTKKPLVIEPVEGKPSTKNSNTGSGKTVNKENIREFYERNELLKERQRISSYERFKKAYLEADTQPKKKDSMPKEDVNPAQQLPQTTQSPHPLQPLTNNFVNNNWIMKTQFKGLKNIKGIDEDLLKKESKPIIIVKPNLNMVVIQNQQQQQIDSQPQRAISEKKKQPMKDLSRQQRDQKDRRQSKQKDIKSKELINGNCNSPDVYLRALKERMLIETNVNRNSIEAQPLQAKKQPSMRKERSSSAKPKMQDSKVRERELFTINDLFDMQTISKPKWKF